MGMTHRTHPRLIAALAALSLTALAACGGANEPSASGDTVAAPATSPGTAPASGDSAIRPATPIQFTGGSAGGNTAMSEAAASATSSDSRMATDMMIAPTYVAEFAVGDALPALPAADTGYVYAADGPASAERAAELAALFGVEGEPVRVDDWEPGGWQVGPTDGSAPALFLSDDAQASWSFSPAYLDQSVGCGVSGSADGGTVAPEISACPEVTAPAGILTADEAEARALELLATLGVDPAGMNIEPYADEWSASVSINDPALGRYWGFGFGAEGALQWANGTIGLPEPVGPFPLIDLDAALARLTEQQAYMPLPVDLARSDVLATEAGTAEAPESDAATSDMVDAAPPATGVLVDPMPVDPAVTYPAPEPITVTLVDVQADFWWAYDVDGSVWLVPAYRFIGDDGGWYTVPAVTDEYLVEVPAPEAPVTEPAAPALPETVPPATSDTAPPAATAPATVPPVSEPAGTEGLDAFVGTTLEEFTAEAEAQGWTVRVTEIDGQSQDVTMDYSTSRVNVSVVTGDDGVQTVKAILSVG